MIFKCFSYGQNCGQKKALKRHNDARQSESRQEIVSSSLYTKEELRKGKKSTEGVDLITNVAADFVMNVQKQGTLFKLLNPIWLNLSDIFLGIALKYSAKRMIATLKEFVTIYEQILKMIVLRENHIYTSISLVVPLSSNLS